MAAILLVSLLALGAPDDASDAEAHLDLRVVESATSKPIPCRVHLLDAAGEAQVPGDLPFFRDHFVCDGAVGLNLAPGTYTYEIERGPEYERVQGEVSLKAGQHVAVETKLRRIANLPERGWYPGDLHVHRPVEDIERLMRAEDLYVAPVITWWNKKDLWSERALPEDPLVRFDGDRFYHLMAGEDERNGGAFLFFNRTTPLEITAAEKEWPSPLAFLEVKGPSTWIDIEKPFWWDVPVALAHGFGDSIGLANNHMCRSSMYESEAWGKPRDAERLPPPRGNGFWSQEIYYHILNCGFRLPPSAGSASGVLPNPVGYNRVYVQVPGEFTYEKWWDGLRAGRSFVTNGPLLLVRANGELPGHVFKSEDTIEIAIAAELIAQDPIPAFEIIKNGSVERTITMDEWKTSNGLGSIRFDESGWFLVRTIADVPHTFRFASSAPFYVEIGNSPKRISKTSAKFFLDWVNERKAAITIEYPDQRAEVMKYHDTAATFWSSTVDNANAE
ncbi:MAG: hypothetical protein AMXMBFR82_23080 [Candidatus Hydrogenedentota bacterium]